MEDQSQNFNGVLKKASLGKGLTPEETRCLLERAGPADWSGLMALAKRLTVENFHSKIFLFAPLYFSNHCVNDCLYCGFRRSNEQVKRHALSVEAFVQEARILWERGHRTLLLVAGEHPDHADARHLGPYLWGLRDAGLDFSVGIEIGPAESHDYRFLKDLGVNRCVLYQETYDPATYRKMHPPGPKTDFDWRYRALSRALGEGIEQIGVGFLAGLSDFRAEVFSLMEHAWVLFRDHGRFPSTISLPRLRPATGVDLTAIEGDFVSDEDFKKILTVLRIALPASGIVLTTRERGEFRDELLRLGIGVTHLSAGVSTDIGGYANPDEEEGEGQFHLSDHRSLDAMTAVLGRLGYQSVMGWGGPGLLSAAIDPVRECP